MNTDARTRVTQASFTRRPVRLLAALFGIAIATSLISAGIGAVSLPPGEVVASIFGRGDETAAFIVQQYRLPRIALAWIVGASLALSGAMIQGVVRNPLAAPEIMGVTGGAGLAAGALIMAYPTSQIFTVPIAAFVGGMMASALVYSLAWRQGVSPVRLALVGVAVGAICDSGLKFLLTKFPVEVNVALAWLTGSVWGRGWTEVWGVLPWFALLTPVAYLYARRLDVLGLGEEMAIGLGERIEATRLIVLVVAVALASSSVAVTGTIPFIGLVAPHIARRLVGENHRVVLPASALLGVLLMLLADTIGRGLLPPLEIPAGLITAVLGAPYFLYLLGRTK